MSKNQRRANTFSIGIEISPSTEELLEEIVREFELGSEDEAIEMLYRVFSLEDISKFNQAIINQFLRGAFSPKQAAQLSMLASTLAMLQQQNIIK